ncbi:pseudouridine synthase [Aquabacterium humicola]|uniref:pseudouridine synthase n=1 Tax=Aquabacterium humicola TaxID=3237377 RepID=UPI00254323A9|nr:pseudouridine synthase [Rubrivivax pictus]
MNASDPAAAPLRLLHADEHLVAIDKPPGLLVHRSALDAHEDLNALDLLRAQLELPLWTVHRLDKGTSGVLLFARSADAARAIGAAFEAGQVHKRYLALVRGWPDAQGEIDQPLARDPERPSTGQQHVEAFTRYRTLARHEWPFPDGRHATSRYALVEVEPLTGRRHQIRRHFKHIGHPLIGDSTHGKGPHNRAVAAWLGTARLWLHAARLQLPAFDGRAGCVIEAMPGDEWRRLLPDTAPATPEVHDAAP